MDKQYKIGDRVRIVNCDQEMCNGEIVVVEKIENDMVRHEYKRMGGHSGHFLSEIEPLEEPETVKAGDRTLDQTLETVKLIELIRRNKELTDTNVVKMTPEQVDEKVEKCLARASRIYSGLDLNFDGSKTLAGEPMEHMMNIIEIAKLILQVEGNK